VLVEKLKLVWWVLLLLLYCPIFNVLNVLSNFPCEAWSCLLPLQRVSCSLRVHEFELNCVFDLLLVGVFVVVGPGGQGLSHWIQLLGSFTLLLEQDFTLGELRFFGESV
jgi:hypothetical protein